MRPPARNLRLVRTETRKPVEARDFRATDDVRSLLTPQDPGALVFVEFDALQEADFVSLIVTISPTIIFDLRAVPRFDVGNLNRRLVFSLFDTASAKYFDITAALGAGKAKQVTSSAENLASALQDLAFRRSDSATGPIVFLGEPTHVESDFMEAVAQRLDHLSERGWKLVKIPEFARSPAIGQRSSIFISHATPDDNDFARWLGIQLSLAGYDVWTDFGRLRGGELFWDTIEDVIRNRAARVIVAGSRLAQSRNGVLDEINLAISVERSLGIDEFVIPLKIDDLPYSEFRANIARKDIIDFSKNWATGLSRLLQTLSRGGIPRVDRDGSPEALAFHSRLDVGQHLRDIPDPILLNWINIKALPQRLYSYSVSAPTHRLPLISQTTALPNVQYGDQILSFASPANLGSALPAGITLGKQGAMLTSEFEKARVSQLPNLRPSEARKYLVQLIHQAWESMCRTRGLHDFQLASKSSAWFAPLDHIEGNKVAFADRNGVIRRKTLVGYSAKRGVHWHFAAELRVAPGWPLRMIVRPHVIFTIDGKQPVDTPARMHTLRRGFCKSWWNDRWRDLSIAYLAWLSGGADTLELNVGSDEPLIISARMIEEFCPVSPEEGDELDTANDIDWQSDVDDAELDEEEVLLIGSNAFAEGDDE